MRGDSLQQVLGSTESAASHLQQSKLQALDSFLDTGKKEFEACGRIILHRELRECVLQLFPLEVRGEEGWTESPTGPGEARRSQFENNRAMAFLSRERHVVDKVQGYMWFRMGPVDPGYGGAVVIGKEAVVARRSKVHGVLKTPEDFLEATASMIAGPVGLRNPVQTGVEVAEDNVGFQ